MQAKILKTNTVMTTAKTPPVASRKGQDFVLCIRQQDTKSCSTDISGKPSTPTQCYSCYINSSGIFEDGGEDFEDEHDEDGDEREEEVIVLPVHGNKEYGW
jgi:hypothetical protein